MAFPSFVCCASKDENKGWVESSCWSCALGKVSQIEQIKKELKQRWSEQQFPLIFRINIWSSSFFYDHGRFGNLPTMLLGYLLFGASVGIRGIPRVCVLFFVYCYCKVWKQKIRPLSCACQQKHIYILHEITEVCFFYSSAEHCKCRGEAIKDNAGRGDALFS